MKRIAICLISGWFICACSSEALRSPSDLAMDQANRESAIEYAKVLDKYSAGDVDYNGFYNSFGFHATIMNSEVLEANVRRQTHFYMWDKNRSEDERNKLFKNAAESTQVFLSFFTPDKKDDNLSTDKSIWRVLLDLNGKRYVGKIKKLKTNLSELITLYPYHTRWNTAYAVSFPVSVSQSETQVSKLTITGPLGSRNIDLNSKTP